MTLERVVTGSTEGAGAGDVGVDEAGVVEGELAGVLVVAVRTGTRVEVRVSVCPALTKVRVIVNVEVEKTVVVGGAEEPACSAAKVRVGKVRRERGRRRIVTNWSFDRRASQGSRCVRLRYKVSKILKNGRSAGLNFA